jgi:hypothetical protein
MQEILIVGDTLDFSTVVPGYLSTDGYTLIYRLVPRVSGTPITLTALADGDNYRVAESPVTTAAWTAGEYTWSAWVEKTGERYSVDSGTVTLKVDPAVVNAYDGRSPARKALDAINDALGTHGSQAHVLEYTIGNRSMRFKDQSDLLTMRASLAAEVWREEAAVKMAAGLPNPRQIRVRMARA